MGQNPGTSQDRRGKIRPEECLDTLEDLTIQLEVALQSHSRALDDLATVTRILQAQIDWMCLPFYKRWRTPRPTLSSNGQPGVKALPSH